jgi:hypothetical protein
MSQIKRDWDSDYGKNLCPNQLALADLTLDKAILKEIAGGKLVGPVRKSKAVAHVRRSLQVGERRACRATGQPRSTQRYRLKLADKDKAHPEKSWCCRSGKSVRVAARTGANCAARVGRSAASECIGFGRRRGRGCRSNPTSAGSLLLDKAVLGEIAEEKRQPMGNRIFLVLESSLTI